MMTELSTARLLLRHFRARDLDPFAEICADPDVMRYAWATGKPLTRAQAWGWMSSMEGHWQLRGYGMWAVEEISTRRLIGRIGLQYPEGFPDIEIAWMLGKPYWGRGFATEGAIAAIKYGFRELQRDNFISMIDPDNHASIRLAERIGEVHEGEVELFGETILLYRIYEDKLIEP
jgi:RimJ/RimL family protein N-acetyltransferase